MPSIAFWPGTPGGTAEYRCYGPGRALQRLGWDVAYVETQDIGYTHDGRVEGDPDILVLSRPMGPDLPGLVQAVHDGGHTFVVYDVDDWFFGIPDYNPAKDDSYPDMFKAMGAAHLVTTSTPELAEGYSHLNRCVVLPNYLDPQIWDWDDNQRFRQKREHIHIGWMGYFHWRSGDLELLKPWVAHFLDEHPEVRFVALGCPELLEFLGVDGLSTPANPKASPTSQTRHIQNYGSLPAMLCHLDISLIPLLSSRFNNAKSWCKGLESNAMGVPVVASASREYRRYLEPGENGLFVRHNEWRKPLKQMMDDLPRYREGARKVAERFYIDDHVGDWVKAYEAAV